MIKSKLVESVRQLVLRQQPTQDSLKQVHPAVIEAELSKAYNTVVKQFYGKDINLMDAELDFYCKSYDLPVSQESYTETNMVNVSNTIYTGRRYVTLTARPIELKRNLGFRSVKPKNGSVSFIRSSETEIESIRDLDVFCCMNKVFYYLNGNKLMFETAIKEFDIIPVVTVKMLVSFDDFADTDNIEFPVGEEMAMELILRTMGFRPTDNTNDDVR